MKELYIQNLMADGYHHSYILSEDILEEFFVTLTVSNVLEKVKMSFQSTSIWKTVEFEGHCLNMSNWGHPH